MIQLSITTKFIFRQLFLSKLIKSLVMAFVILTAVKVRVFSTPNYMCRHDFRNGYGFKISTSSVRMSNQEGDLLQWFVFS